MTRLREINPSEGVRRWNGRNLVLTFSCMAVVYIPHCSKMIKSSCNMATALSNIKVMPRRHELSITDTQNRTTLSDSATKVDDNISLVDCKKFLCL